eukprot:TRINITY_DN7690_c0_g3_i1.p1 TRINITY_DN7690_c0_g3~~TRINITY_DN7690_c0_g3_i1.p1  ORF type:complete len:138 (+),score=6.37 TRINITY_DN7690_c0_g3_i1:133-546(+)
MLFQRIWLIFPVLIILAEGSAVVKEELPGLLKFVDEDSPGSIILVEGLKCPQPCKHNGICEAGKCFCPYPYYGDACTKTYSKTLKTFSRTQTGLICLASLIIGAFCSLLCCLCLERSGSDDEKATFGDTEEWKVNNN